MSEEEIMQLHESCHCFVNTSYGEAWSYPAFDAMGMGNCVISTYCGGPKDFLRKYNNSGFVDGRYKPVFGMENENFSNYNSSRELWMETDIDVLRTAMRMAYLNNCNKQEKLQIVKEYSRENVGNLMKGSL